MRLADKLQYTETRDRHDDDYRYGHRRHRNGEGQEAGEEEDVYIEKRRIEMRDNERPHRHRGPLSRL
jgi:hypothetical protein